MKIDARQGDLDEKKNNLLLEEHDARELQKTESLKEAEKYFKSREGMAEMKRSMKTILESYEFQSKNIGVDEKDPTAASRARKTEALKQARQEYTTELYVKNVHEIAARSVSASQYRSIAAAVLIQPLSQLLCTEGRGRRRAPARCLGGAGTRATRSANRSLVRRLSGKQLLPRLHRACVCLSRLPVC